MSRFSEPSGAPLSPSRPGLRPAEWVCLVVIAASTLALIAELFPPLPRIDRGLQKAVGAALGRQALALAAPGGKIVVITRDTESFSQPALETALAAFQREVGRTAVKLASIQRLQLDPLRPAEVPSGDFLEQIRRASPGQVIVSFLGPPLLLEDQWARLRPVKPKIVAFCPGSIAQRVDLRGLFEAGFLQAAVVERPLPTDGPGRMGSRPTFEQLYLTLTATNLSDWRIDPAHAL